MNPAPHLISPQSPLSPCYNHCDKLKLGNCFGHNDVILPSIEAAFWFVVIGQHELANGAHRSTRLTSKFLQDQHLLWSPKETGRWLREQGVHISCETIRKSGDIYFAIMIHLVESHKRESKNSFAAEVISIVSQCENPPGFIYCKRFDRVLSCGQTIRSAEKFLSQGPLLLQGQNCWGLLLNKLARQLKEDNLWPTVGWEKLTGISVISPLQSNRKVVLLVSDSYLKHIHELSSGDLVRQSGGRFGTIAAELKKYDLASYDYIIVHIGFNDAKSNMPLYWESSWKEFEQAIAPEITRRGANADTILFSPGFLHPSHYYELETFFGWLKRKVSKYGVSFCDWSQGCPLLQPDKSINNKYFDKERNTTTPIHVNHMGTGILWAEWSRYLPGLEYVHLTVSGSPYFDSSTCKTTDDAKKRVQSYVVKVAPNQAPSSTRFVPRSKQHRDDHHYVQPRQQSNCSYRSYHANRRHRYGPYQHRRDWQ